MYEIIEQIQGWPQNDCYLDELTKTVKVPLFVYNISRLSILKEFLFFTQLQLDPLNLAISLVISE
jgi:hypothetical protein